MSRFPGPGRRARAAAGFTLVEMMVALFVFGLIAAAGVTVMGFAVANQAVVRDHADRLAAFQRARGVLKADLAQAAPRRTRGLDGLAAARPFTGGEAVENAALLTLVRRGWENPDGRPRASLQYVEYRLVQGRLERAARPALDGAPLGPPQVLIDGVQAAQVAFLSRGRWSSPWRGDPGVPLPDAVRLDLALEGLGPVTQLFLTPAPRP